MIKIPQTFQVCIRGVVESISEGETWQSWMQKKWEDTWAAKQTPLHNFVPSPSDNPPCQKLKRMEAVHLNHLLTGIGRFAHCMHQWGLATSPLCECGHVQTADHILDHCPIFAPPNGRRGLQELDLTSRSWLANG